MSRRSPRRSHAPLPPRLRGRLARRGCAALDPLVDQAGQALGLPPLPPVLDGRDRDRRALRGQFGGLGMLPPGQAGALGVIRRPRRSPGGRVRGRPSTTSMMWASHRRARPGSLRRQPGQPGPGGRAPARTPRLQPHPAAAHQFRDRGLLDGTVIAGEPDPRSRGTQHNPGPPVDDDPVPGPDLPRRAGLRGHREAPAGTRHAIEELPSRTDMSQASSRRQSR